MFDEDYGSHKLYNLKTFTKWFEEATCFVFVGTSFAVTVTDMALKEAKRRGGVKVFNFNVSGGELRCNGADVSNVVGGSEVTLPALVESVKAGLLERGEKRVKCDDGGGVDNAAK